MSRIYVDAGDAPALIASAPTGVFYTNQTGGLACNHPALEGFLVPLGNGTPLPDESCCFISGWGDGEMPEATAQIIEQHVVDVTRWSGSIRDFTIQRDEKHEEAWIRCSWTMLTGSEWADESSRRHFDGVLTYQNCD
jgi:hypothetical protein